jgi:small conductance mechanosensitive channel
MSNNITKSVLLALCVIVGPFLYANGTDTGDVFQQLGELQDRIEKLNSEVEQRDFPEKRIFLMRLQNAEEDYIRILHNHAVSVLELKEGHEDPRLLDLMRVEPLRIRAILERNLMNFQLPTGDEKAADLATLHAKLKTTLKDRDEWYDALLTNLSLSADLGLDTGIEEQMLKRAVRERAANASSFLELTMQDLGALNERATILPDDKEIQSLYSVGVVLVATAAEELQIVTDDMESLGLDASQYKAQLIAATGSISHDLFAVDVLSDLVAGGMEVVTDWLRIDGLSLIFNVLLFVIILVISRVLSRWVGRGTEAALKMSTKPVSTLLQRMLVSSAASAVYLIGVLIALSQIGISLGPLLTGLGIAGFIIGFALQDTLANFASGMMILFYRPFDVGDLIDAQGIFGEVSHMSLVNTTILTLDNQTLIVPNSKIWGDVVKNVTAQKIRRVDLVFGIGYSDDIDKTEAVLTEIVNNHEMVLDEPEAMIKLHELGDSSVNFIVRPWVKTADYWDVYWDITRSVKLKFDEKGISIPFPQRDVHIYKDE